MSVLARTLACAGLVLLLASPAMADDGKTGEGLWALSVVSAGVLLLALPLAVVVRATCSFPARIARGFRERGHTKRFLGIAGLVVGLVLVNLLGRAPATGILALLILLFLCIVVLAGLTVAGSHLGARLFGEPDRGQGVGAFVLGWLLLAGTALFPVLGLLTMLYFAVWGAGAILLALFGGKTEEAEPLLDG